MEGNGNLQEFLDLYPAILRKAFWLCNKNWHDAEDLTQNAYLVICQHYDQYTPELSGKYAWCIGVLRHARTNNRKKIDQIPMRKLFHRGEKFQNVTTQFKPWSNTTRKNDASKWGRRRVKGGQEQLAMGEKKQGDIDFWFEGITRDNLKNYLCLHLDDDMLEKMKGLSEKMFQAKFLIGLGFTGKEISKKEGIAVNTVKSRSQMASQKMKYGKVRNYIKSKHPTEVVDSDDSPMIVKRETS